MDRNSLPMEHVFHSFKELEDEIYNYQVKEKREVSIYSSKLLQPTDPYFKTLEYYSFTYKCAGFGEFETRAKTNRRTKASKKCGCEFQMKIGLSNSKDGLVIMETSNLTHNEKCDQQSEEGLYFPKRRNYQGRRKHEERKLV